MLETAQCLVYTIGPFSLQKKSQHEKSQCFTIAVLTNRDVSSSGKIVMFLEVLRMPFTRSTIPSVSKIAMFMLFAFSVQTPCKVLLEDRKIALRLAIFLAKFRAWTHIIIFASLANQAIASYCHDDKSLGQTWLWLWNVIMNVLRMIHEFLGPVSQRVTINHMISYHIISYYINHWYQSKLNGKPCIKKINRLIATLCETEPWSSYQSATMDRMWTCFNTDLVIWMTSK